MMMNLEIRQLQEGGYMQGVQIEVRDIIPVLEHLHELLLLPKAMHWIGEANFELAALSESAEHRIRLCRFLNLRIRVSAEAKDCLKNAVSDAAMHLKGWLGSVGVECRQVRYDDEGMIVRMPASGFSFIEKNPIRSGGGYTRMLLPLGEQFSIDPSAIAAQLCRHPLSGITLQLTPDEWRSHERNAITRFAGGERIPQEEYREAIENGIVCFNCAVWGAGAEALSNLITGSANRELVRRPRMQGEESLVQTLVCDPWQTHRRNVGASRYKGVLTVKEVNQIFRCKPLRLAGEEAGISQPAVDIEAAMEELRRLIDQKLVQAMEQSAQTAKELVTAAADDTRKVLETEIRSSAEKTEAHVIGQVDRAKSEIRQYVDLQNDGLREKIVGSEEAMKKQFREEIAANEEAMQRQIQTAVDELHEVVSEEEQQRIHLLTNMIEQIHTDVNELRINQEKLRELLEKRIQLSDNQLSELTAMLTQLSGEHDELKRELLINTVSGAEKPLTMKALKFMGLSSEQDLLDRGMRSNHLAILRIAMSGLEGKRIMENVSPSAEDRYYYHPYIMFLGFLYEQIVRTYYHESIYAPYYMRVMPLEAPPPVLTDTDLVHYEQGPYYLQSEDKKKRRAKVEYDTSAWQKRTMAERFSRCVTINDKTRSVYFWDQVFTRMEKVRRIRNKIHNLSIEVDQAYEMVQLMLKQENMPGMVRLIVSMGRAIADFSGL